MLRNTDDFEISGLHDKMSLDFFKCKNILKYVGHDGATLPFHVELEVPITDLRGYVVGYWDAIVYVKMDLLEERHCWEFKPFIKSMGETIRQIQRYWQYPVRGYYRKICGPPTRVYLWTRDPVWQRVRGPWDQDVRQEG
jgi:hypothetical protein